MRKVSRWYDVDIQYQGQIPTRQFDGSISRDANLADLLKVLEFNNIHFTVNDKTITVKPYLVASARSLSTDQSPC